MLALAIVERSLLKADSLRWYIVFDLVPENRIEPLIIFTILILNYLQELLSLVFSFSLIKLIDWTWISLDLVCLIWYKCQRLSSSAKTVAN